MLVCEEAAPYALDVPHAHSIGLFFETGKHHVGNIHRHHPAAKRSGRKGKRTRASADIYESAGLVQAKLSEQSHVLVRVCARFPVITLRVLRIKMFGAGVCEFIWKPAMLFHVLRLCFSSDTSQYGVHFRSISSA